MCLLWHVCITLHSISTSESESGCRLAFLFFSFHKYLKMCFWAFWNLEGLHRFRNKSTWENMLNTSNPTYLFTSIRSRFAKAWKHQRFHLAIDCSSLVLFSPRAFCSKESSPNIVHFSVPAFLQHAAFRNQNYKNEFLLTVSFICSLFILCSKVFAEAWAHELILFTHLIIKESVNRRMHSGNAIQTNHTI